VENVYIIFQQINLGNLSTKFHRNHRSFIENNRQKYFSLFFPDTVYYKSERVLHTFEGVWPPEPSDFAHRVQHIQTLSDTEWIVCHVRRLNRTSCQVLSSARFEDETWQIHVFSSKQFHRRLIHDTVDSGDSVWSSLIRI